MADEGASATTLFPAAAGKAGRAVVLPDRSPGAWPGQGLGLMALTKLPPSSSFPEKGEPEPLTVILL